MSFQWPSFEDVLEARRVISPHLPKTPFYSYPVLNHLLGTEVYVKHENYLPTGAFKIRGGINLISRLTEEQKKKGVITASTGNQAQSIALASMRMNVPATIVMPEKANPSKVKSAQGYGAEVIFSGRIFDESMDYAEKLAGERGARFIHPANEPHLIAGVGTYALEMLEEVPDLDMIIVPVGGGSGASGCCLVKEAVNPMVNVIAVQARSAPAAFRSWKQKTIVQDQMETCAEGLATATGYELTQDILQAHLYDFLLVTDEDMHEAIRIMMELVRNMVEEAGAAAFAAALKIKNLLKGKKVGLVLSGGNISLQRLKSILN